MLGKLLREKGLWDRRYRQIYLLLGLILVLLTASMLWKRGRLGTNARSRFITVERLVEAHTWAHAAPGDTTPFELSIDAVRIGDRIYSSKPPNYPLLMAAEAKVMRTVTGLEFHSHFIDYLRVLLFLNQVLPYVLMVFLAFVWLRRLTDDPWTQRFMVLAMGIGILPAAYAPSLNNHTVSAILFFVSFYLSYRILVLRDLRQGLFFLLGLLAGFAGSIELPGFAFAGAFFLLVLWHHPRRAVWTALGLALPIASSLWVYYELSGTMRPFYLQSGLYRYAGSYWNQPEGMDALNEPKATYLFNMLLGRRGLFAMTPLLLLAVPGARSWWRQGSWPLRQLLIAVGVATLAVLAFVLTRTQNYGGDCIGMRWLMLFMPILLFLAWPVILDWGRRPWGKWLAVTLLVWGIFWMHDAYLEDAFIIGRWERIWLSLFG